MFANEAELADFTGDDTLEGQRGTLLLRQASAVIRNYCRQTFDLVEDDEVELRGTWSRKLQLPERPVTDVGTVLLDGAEVDDWSRVRDSLFRHNWGGPEVVVTVTYSHGFDEDSQPWQTLKAICLQVAARAAPNPSGLANYSTDGTSVNFRDVGLTAAEQATLDRFRHEYAA